MGLEGIQKKRKKVLVQQPAYVLLVVGQRSVHGTWTPERDTISPLDRRTVTAHERGSFIITPSRAAEPPRATCLARSKRSRIPPILPWGRGIFQA